MKTISFDGKTSDSFCMCIRDASDNLVKEYDGYPPTFLGFDGVSLEIDIETGTIIGWDAKKVKEELEEMVLEE